MAWLGGGAFAASLGYLVYFYTVTLGSAAENPDGALWNALFDVALFSTFALHHSLFARSPAKRWIATLVPAHAERSVYVWVASALLVAVCLLWQSLPGVAYQAQGLVRVPLYGLQALGVILAIRGAGVIDPLELAGIRPLRGRPCPLARPSRDTLKVVGPFRIVRHPIYLGWMLMVVAAPTMTVNRAVFAAITSAYLILAIPWEEKSLVAAHGDQYRVYQRTVRWRVVPGIW